MTTEQKVELKVRFDSYRIINFEYHDPQIPITAKKADLKFDFNFKATFKYNLDASTIEVKLAVNILYHGKELLPVGSIEVDYVYKVLGLNELESDGNGIIIPDTFLTTLVSLAYSTTRGIILVKGAGTILGGIILPIIDPRKLLPKQQIEDNQAES